MFKSAITLTFILAIQSIASTYLANEIGTLMLIASIAMTTCATELALYFGE
jgi:hypothetical protein